MLSLYFFISFSFYQMLDLGSVRFIPVLQLQAKYQQELFCFF